MKHLWALLSTLVLTAAIAVTGVAAWASTTPLGDVAEGAAASQDTSSMMQTVTAHGFSIHLTPPQELLAGTLLLARRGAHVGSHGTRSDKQFFEISSTGDNDVPAAALRAYKHAEKVMAATDPGCHISWTLLAAIGRVESDHGRVGGAQIGSDGISRPEIRGPQLNGAGAFAAISDSDHGVLDHDKVWDRAVGQMQFLPQTWQSVARDGDGDGQMNPDDIDDSALGSAVYLCGAGGSLADQPGMARAAFRYNHSDYYVQLVLSFVAGYQTGVFALPSPPPPPATKAKTVQAKGVAPKHPSKPRHTGPTVPKVQPRTPESVPTGTAKPTAKPKPTPKPTPKPSPAGPVLVQEDGTWNACGAGFCLGTAALDLGSPSVLGSIADSDFDGDGAVEHNSDEFAGLVGKHVSLKVEHGQGGFVVYVIDGHGLRNADGSFARTVANSTASDTTP